MPCSLLLQRKEHRVLFPLALQRKALFFCRAQSALSSPEGRAQRSSTLLLCRGSYAGKTKMPCYALLCLAMPCSALLCLAMPSYALLKKISFLFFISINLILYSLLSRGKSAEHSFFRVGTTKKHPVRFS